MRRFPKEASFQDQMLLYGTAEQEEIPIHDAMEQEENKELLSIMQRLANKHFL